MNSVKHEVTYNCEQFYRHTLDFSVSSSIPTDGSQFTQTASSPNTREKGGQRCHPIFSP